MAPHSHRTRWLPLGLTIGVCLGLGTAGVAWTYKVGVTGRIDRLMRGRALVSEDGALDLIARASSQGHTAANRAAALARVKASACPRAAAPHVLWIYDDKGTLLLLCGGKKVAQLKPDLEGMLGPEGAAGMLAKIRKEGIARHPPLAPREADKSQFPPHQLTGRQFEPWRWVVGTTLSVEWIRERGAERERKAQTAGLVGAGVALLCLVGLLLGSRRRSTTRKKNQKPKTKNQK